MSDFVIQKIIKIFECILKRGIFTFPRRKIVDNSRFEYVAIAVGNLLNDPPCNQLFHMQSIGRFEMLSYSYI